jgi:hypothetical protein
MKDDTYQLNWKRGHKVRSKQRKRTKQFSATTDTRFLKVYETRSGWVGVIRARNGFNGDSYHFWKMGGVVNVEEYVPKTVGPCADSRQARIACEVILSLEEKS